MTLLATARQVGPLALLGSVSRGLVPGGSWLPAGETLRGRLFRHGAEPALGVALVDEPGPVDVRVLLGHVPGLPGARPSVSTMAVRLDGDGRPADLVLRARPTGRSLPRRRRDCPDDGGPLLVSTTAYDAAGRPLLLAARPCGAETFELFCLVGDPARERWRSFADLRVCRRPPGEPQLVPDPVGNPLPGLALLSPWAGRAV